ncbi:amino acid ABC transporter permease [Shinella sp. M27]|uniref:amino acid ABC transporter permease n=1 Tax=Shinella sp. M27 TaxID=3368614 RepID=UPI003BA26163
MAGLRRVSALMNSPVARGFVLQALLGIAMLALAYMLVHNLAGNLQRANIRSGFAFLEGRAGFEIARPLIQYTIDSTYGRALAVGFLNTLMVAVAGIVSATIIGFCVGIGRLSQNWLLARLCALYVEFFRNLPPLLVVFFWYLGILSVLPHPRESLRLPLDIYLNNRGLTVPIPEFGNGMGLVAGMAIASIASSILLMRWARIRQARTGKRFPIVLACAGLISGSTIAAFLAAGAPLTFSYPVAGTFNLAGGSTIGPEFISLYLALSFYTASFIAEIVRAGIQGVPKGQTEAARALGLRSRAITSLIVVPQAFRIIIPPLTSQYLNLTKNSSLAIAVGFSDLIAVGGTTLNQTGQAIEVIAIWMTIYLGLSVTTSVFMNWFNARMALVER